MRLQVEDLTYRLAAVAGLRDDLPVGLLFENLADALAHQRVVVAEHDSQFSHVPSPG